MEKKSWKWETLQSEYLIKRPWLTARRDVVKLPTGKIYDEYYVLEYPDWVNVIAIDENGMMLMERQYRNGAGILSTEICAGVVEKGEEPLAAAKRELWEETGYTGGTWRELMVISSNPGSQNNWCHCFVAEGVKRTSGQHLDATEDLEPFLATRKEVYEWLQNGVFKQSLMIAPLWKYFVDSGIPE